jgi:DNA-binding transcriptional ArsR family regulator
LTNGFFKSENRTVGSGIDVLTEGERLRGTLSPVRRRLLAELREPASASGLAARLGESRQRLNYHLRELERGGLVELVEERQRRGRVERVLRATAGAVIVAPAVAGELPAEQDRFAVDALLTATARTFNDVARLREGAARAGKRLVTFAIEAEVGFDRPADIARFADQLADKVAELASQFGATGAGRRYRLIIGGHPARPEDPRTQEDPGTETP